MEPVATSPFEGGAVCDHGGFFPGAGPRSSVEFRCSTELRRQAVLNCGSCKLYLSPRLRKSKALELHVGVLEEVSKHLAQAGGKRIEILKSSTDWKQCYRTWETEKGLNSQPWRMHEVLAENRMDKETLQREHFQHMPEAVHTFHAAQLLTARVHR